MDVTQILMLITILVYLAAMVGIGAVLAKQNQTRIVINIRICVTSILNPP